MRRISLKLLMFSFAVAAAQVSAAADYVKPELGVRLSPPEGWETLTGSGGSGAEVFFFAPADSQEDHFRENVNLVARDAPPGLTEAGLRDVVEAEVQQMAQPPLLGKFAPAAEVKLAGRTCVTQTGTIEMKGRTLKLKQWCIIHEGKVLTFTYTALETTFDKYAAGADALVTSLKLGAATPASQPSH